VQQVSNRGTASSLVLQPANSVGAGNRLIVETGIWSSSAATAQTVTDSAGNTYTKLTSFKASDNAEMSVWTAPITAGGGSRPTVTIKATGTADVGAALLEYSGLSSASGTGVVDQLKTATGKTGAAASTAVSSGATTATTGAGDLAIGLYADSGFADTLTGDSTYATRVNVSPTGDMELLAQDRVLGAAGATPNPTTTTGPNTPWLAATIALKPAAPPPAGAATTMAAAATDPPATRIYASDIQPGVRVRLPSGRIFFCPLGLVPLGSTPA
jgi:hypothetical protein